MAHLLNMVGQDSEILVRENREPFTGNIVLWIVLSRNRRDIQIYTDGRTFNRIKGLQHGHPNIDFVNHLMVLSFILKPSVVLYDTVPTSRVQQPL